VECVKIDAKISVTQTEEKSFSNLIKRIDETS